MGAFALTCQYVYAIILISMANKQKLIIVIAVVLVVAIIIYWYVDLRNPASVPVAQPPAAPPAAPPPPPAATTTPGLGGTIYNQSQNPIQDKVPTTNPAVNPIEGAYKNPFQ